MMIYYFQPASSMPLSSLSLLSDGAEPHYKIYTHAAWQAKCSLLHTGQVPHAYTCMQLLNHTALGGYHNSTTEIPLPLSTHL